MFKIQIFISRQLYFCLFAVVLLATATVASTARANNPLAVAWQQPGEQWLSFTTEHFQFNYLKAHQAQADRAAIIAEKAWPIVTSDLEWTPKDKVQVVIVDDFDYSNGFASPMPYSQIRLFLSPPENMSGLEFYDDWMNLLITHELTHVVHLDMAMGAPSTARKVLGRYALTFPHAFTPGFMTEGLAVYKETDYQRGYGRGQSAYYQMLMRQEVIDGIDDLSQVTLPLRDWPLGKHYLYGYYYYAFLAERYGSEKVTEYLHNYSYQLLPFFLQNRTARNTFGKSHVDLWTEFKLWLKLKFTPQITAIEQQPLVTGKAITNDGMQFDPITANEKYYYYLYRNGTDRPTIIQTDVNGNKKKIMSLNRVIDMDVTEKQDLLITRYVSDGDGRGWSDIFRINDGDEQRLTHKKRYRSARWLKQGENIIAKRIANGYSELDLLSAEGDFIRQLWKGSLDEVVGDFSVSHQGDLLVASVKRKQQGWNLELFDLNSRQWEPLTQTKAVESGVRFEKGDAAVIFSANYGDTYNIYRMNLADGETEQLTHVMGGAIKPAQVGDEIFYQGYSSAGYNHYQLASEKAIQTFNIASQDGVYNYPDWYQQPLDRSKAEDYQPWSTLRPYQWFPSFISSESSSQIGLLTTGSDALSRHLYSAAISYDTKNQLTAFKTSYFYDNKWNLQANRVHEYRVSANTLQLNVRQEDSLELTRINILNAFENKLDFSAGIQSAKGQDLEGSGFLSRFLESKAQLVGVRLDFDNRESYRYSIGPSWGNKSSFIFETNDTLKSDYTGDVYNINISQSFDLSDNHVLVVNTSGAYGTKNPRPFTLGGEISVLKQTFFGRNTWALRGYNSGIQMGTRIQTNSIEYRFPITNIERNWNLIPIGIGQISSNIFIENGAAWSKGGQAHYLRSVGFEIRSEFIASYSLILPMNIGYAYGLDDKKGGGRAYVRLGYTF